MRTLNLIPMPADRLPKMHSRTRRIIAYAKRYPKSSDAYLAKKFNITEPSMRKLLIKYGVYPSNAKLRELDVARKVVIRKTFEENPTFPRKDLIPLLEEEGFPGVKPTQITRYVRELKGEGVLIKEKQASSPRFIVESRRRAVALLMKDNPYMTQASIARKLKTSTTNINDDVKAITTRMRREQAEGYEIYREKTLQEIAAIKQRCLDRYDGNIKKASSRWLEVWLQAVEKEAKLLGLNAPERKIIDTEITVQSKEERDAVIDAYIVSEEGIPQVTYGGDLDSILDAEVV